MKKIKILGLILAVGALVCGCSCSKADEDTYANAVSTYKSTDAISFSRLETIAKEGEATYTRKLIDAKYAFDSNKKVSKMEYSNTVSIASNNGGTHTQEVTKYYYDNEKTTMYTYYKEGNQTEDSYKESDMLYEDKFNINTCMTSDCLRMIVGSFAPIFELNEVSNFSIEGEKEIARVSFSAICPSYENCASNSQLLNYEMTIGSDGNIETLEYEIVNGVNTHVIKYTFYDYGSNNVKVVLPNYLESYNEKIS